MFTLYTQPAAFIANLNLMSDEESLRMLPVDEHMKTSNGLIMRMTTNGNELTHAKFQSIHVATRESCCLLLFSPLSDLFIHCMHQMWWQTKFYANILHSTRHRHIITILPIITTIIMTTSCRW